MSENSGIEMESMGWMAIAQLNAGCTKCKVRFPSMGMRYVSTLEGTSKIRCTYGKMPSKFYQKNDFIIRVN